MKTINHFASILTFAKACLMASRCAARKLMARKSPLGVPILLLLAFLALSALRAGAGANVSNVGTCSVRIGSKIPCNFTTNWFDFGPGITYDLVQGQIDRCGGTPAAGLYAIFVNESNPQILFGAYNETPGQDGLKGQT
jgi:hypothetical protein